MFELFKTRAFADYISDTFQFLKIYGKHYFKNYLKFAFVALLILMVAMAMIGMFYSRVMATSLGGFGGAETFDNNFVTENAVMLIISTVLIIIVAIYLSILNYSYPVYYLRFLSKNANIKPELSDIRTHFKSDLGRLVIFGILVVIIFGIIALISLGIATVLSFILIGLLLFPIIIPLLTTWSTLTLYFYLNQNQSFFEALQNALGAIFKNFWSIIGASFCIMLIVYIINMAVTMIPYMILMFSMFFGIQNPEHYETFSSSDFSLYMILMVIIYCLGMLTGLILNHLMLIQTGLVYYSERENTEHHSLRQSIDEIGTNE